MISFWDLERKKKKADEGLNKEIAMNIPMDPSIWTDVDFDLDYQMTKDKKIVNKSVSLPHILVNNLELTDDNSPWNTTANPSPRSSSEFQSSDVQAVSAIGVNQDTSSVEKLVDDFTVDFSQDSDSEYNPSDNFVTKHYLSPIDTPKDPRYYQEWYPVDTNSLHITSIKDRMLKEIMEFQFDKNIHIRRNNRRFLFLYDIKDARLFDSICYWKAANPNCTFMDALEEFVDYEHSDALVKVIFSNHYSPWDAMIKYKLKSKRQQLLEDIFRLLNKDMKREYQTVNAIRGKAITHILKTRLFVEFEKLEEDEDRRFLKILAPFEVLCHEAEKVGMRINLSINYLKEIIQAKESKLKLSDALPAVSIYNNRNLDLTEAQLNGIVLPLLNSVKESRSVPYIAKNIELYKGGDGPKPNVYNIILGCSINLQVFRKDEYSIEDLIEISIFDSFYPVHDGPLYFESQDYNDNASTVSSIKPLFRPGQSRADLYQKWKDGFKWRKFISYDPSRDIRNYFGDQHGFYFTWIYFYHKWLAFAAVLGLVVVAFGIFRAMTTVIVTNFQQKLFLVIDNELTPFFAILMNFWLLIFNYRSILMLKFWRRTENLTAFRWDTYGVGPINSERPRPEWKPSVIGISPITGQKEYQTTFKERMTKKLITSAIMLSFLVLLAGLIAALVAMQGFVREQLQSAGSPKFFLQIKISDFSTGIAGSIFTVMQIVLLKPVFTWITVQLNDYENHKTRTEIDHGGAIELCEFVLSYNG
ncbi:Anoctamin-7 [Boothiomyces sp. JEL0838]|nr:Anoctamin-7 [Boothiomyces sp. JEL0838]